MNGSTGMARWQPPMWYERLAGLTWRAVVIVAGLALAVALVSGLSPVLLPMFLGLLYASALRPISAWLRARGVPNAVAATLAIASLIVAFAVVTWLTVVAVADQWPSISAAVAAAVDELIDAAVAAGIESSAAETIATELRDGVGTIVELLVEGAASLLPAIASFVATVVLSLFVTFFYLKDGPRMWAWVVSRAGDPGPLLDRVGQRVWSAVSSFILGQTAIAAIDATFIAVGAIALGVPEVAAIFMLTFFGAYIPYIGASLSGLLAVMLAIADGGLSKGLWMTAIVLAVQVLEGNVFQPWIQGRTMRLHPLVIALAVTFGGAVAGLLGILLAVPLTAACVVALSELRAAGYVGGSSRG